MADLELERFRKMRRYMKEKAQEKPEPEVVSRAEILFWLLHLAAVLVSVAYLATR